MAIINVEDLKPGMVLAGDLICSNGRFLLPKNAVLEEKHLQICKAWGVVEADVKGVDADRAREEAFEELDQEILARSRMYTKRLFPADSLKHPAMREIFRLCVLRNARRMAEDGDLPDPLAEVPPQAGISPAHDMFAPGTGSAKEMVREEVRLSSFPDIYFRITEVLNSPNSSASHIADVVGLDPSLSAKLLKLVNSSFYGFPSKIDSIPRAIAILGTNELTTLALGISAVQFFKGICPGFVDMKSFWMHSIACGIFARVFAGNKVGLSEERFFVAGLLHDIGRLVMLRKLPHAMSQAMGMARKKGIPLFKAERAVIGFDHARVGGLLLEEWKFPVSLVGIIKNHHAPGRGKNMLDPTVIQVADILAVAMMYGSSGSHVVPELRDNAWDVLGVSTNVLSLAVSQADRQLHDIVQTFLEG